jgi:hypothetical protein
MVLTQRATFTAINAHHADYGAEPEFVQRIGARTTAFRQTPSGLGENCWLSYFRLETLRRLSGPRPPVAAIPNQNGSI